MFNISNKWTQLEGGRVPICKMHWASFKSQTASFIAFSPKKSYLVLRSRERVIPRNEQLRKRVNLNSHTSEPQARSTKVNLHESRVVP